MQRRDFTLLSLASLGQFGCARKGDTPVNSEGASAPRNATVTVRVLHVIGDSTAAEFPPSDGRVGWAAASALGSELAGVRVNDAARSGRSSKSFTDEGHFAAVEAQLAPGDLLLVQFGHNDEKDDPARHTDAATTFRDNLRRYVSAARAHGAIPILLTPICRRRFTGTRVTQSHGDYPDATRAVATETQTPLIDMTLKTTELVERLGPDGSLALFAANDNTHLNAQGAQAVARLVIEGLRQLGFTPPERTEPRH